MFEVVSERVTDWLLENETIPREDKEIYRYGIQQGMIALLNLGTTMVIGMVFGKLLESILFMAAYIPLRSYAGGYHAKTAVRCYVFSIVMISAVLWVMRCVTYSGLVCGCLTAISGSMIWILAPVEDRNKPLDDVEKVVYRKRARRILLFESAFLFVSLLQKWKSVAISMTMAFCVLAVMLLMGRWKNRRVNVFSDKKTKEDYMKHNVKKLLILALTFFVLTPAVTAEAYSVELVGIEDTNHDHTSVYDMIDDYLNTMGYANADINKSTNISPSTLLSRLPRREIVVTRSHGGRFLDSAGNTTGNYLVLNDGNMYNSDIEAFSANKLADTVLAVYVGCYTASGGVSSSSARNLVVASTEKGATTAVGFEDSIDCEGANTWTDYFFWYLSIGRNIDRAANDAVSVTRAMYRELDNQGQLGISSMRYRGEWNYTFTN